MKSKGFGKFGWLLILACIFIMYCASSAQISSLNVVVPRFVEMYGWSQAQLMSVSSYSAFITASICVVFSAFAMNGKNGKAICLISMVIACVGMMLWGTATQLWC